MGVGLGVGAGQKKKTKQRGKFDLKSEKHSYGTLNPNLCIKHFLLLVNDTDANYKLLRTLKILGLPLKKYRFAFDIAKMFDLKLIKYLDPACKSQKIQGREIS